MPTIIVTREKTMTQYQETIDLYSDDGKMLKSGVSLNRIHPLLNPAICRIVDLTKRTINVNLLGIEQALSSAKLGKGRIPGRELKLPIMEHKDSLVARIKEMVQLEEDDDTEIMEFNNGNPYVIG